MNTVICCTQRSGNGHLTVDVIRFVGSCQANGTDEFYSTNKQQVIIKFNYTCVSDDGGQLNQSDVSGLIVGIVIRME